MIENDSKGWKKTVISKGEFSAETYITSFSPNSVHVALIGLDKNINLFEHHTFSTKKPVPISTKTLFMFAISPTT